jgi:ferric-dicitrate binding protein FerR (iron transport regulator)
VPLGVHTERMALERIRRLEELRAADKELRKVDGELQAERDKRYCERNKRQDDAIEHVEEMHETMRKSDSEAVDKAFASATKLSEAHNDLLRKMEKLTETFATKDVLEERATRTEEAIEGRITRLESWQARLSGGLLVIAAVGLANFVKLWTG